MGEDRQQQVRSSGKDAVISTALALLLFMSQGSVIDEAVLASGRRTRGGDLIEGRGRACRPIRCRRGGRDRQRAWPGQGGSQSATCEEGRGQDEAPHRRLISLTPAVHTVAPTAAGIATISSREGSGPPHCGWW
ncbi:hypothetical protein [Streptomyces sp. NPDC056160]|uniref:hypothetical protein n=1 Tax=Streptomyces sp. NPDC056160 TaxID=3345731 RepID=UPI0035DF8B19